MTRVALSSSWLASASYASLGGGQGVLSIETRKGECLDYVIPSWLFGLFCAAKSPGWALNRLVKRQAEYLGEEPCSC